MNQFKKAFRGYQTVQVDQRLLELEAQLKASEARCELLEKQLNETKRTADRAQAQLEDRNAALEELKDRYEQLRLEQNVEKNQAEAIGRVYIKAFESGREIAMAPTPYVERFLSDIESATQKSGLEISDAKRDFADASDKIAAVIADINRQTAFLNRRLEELAAGIENMNGVYMRFDSVKDATKADIDRIRRNYEQTAGDYKDMASYRTAAGQKSASVRGFDTTFLSPDQKTFTAAISGKPLSEKEYPATAAPTSPVETHPDDLIASAQAPIAQTPSVAGTPLHDMQIDRAAGSDASLPSAAHGPAHNQPAYNPIDNNAADNSRRVSTSPVHNAPDHTPAAANETVASAQPAATSGSETDNKGKIDNFEFSEKSKPSDAPKQDQEAGPGQIIKAPEAMDTAADFREQESAAAVGASSEPGAQAAGGAKEQDKVKVRGQNIVNLLNKYQKR